MYGPQRGHLRITRDRFDLWLLSEHGEVVDLTIALGPDTAAALRRVIAGSDHPSGCPRSSGRDPLLIRALRSAGGLDPRLDIHHGEPPRFVLVLPGPWGHQEVDLDLAEATELIIGRRVPLVARGWPRHDWDTALVGLAPEQPIDRRRATGSGTVPRRRRQVDPPS